MSVTGQPPTSQDMYNVLRSIDETLKTLLARTGRREAVVGKEGGAVAPDADLDGKFGDPEVRFTPRDWTGPVFKGNRYSECPPEFLDMLGDSLDYFAGKSEASNAMTSGGKPKAPYERADAARARGWAKRLRNGWQVPAFEPEGSMHPHAVPTEPTWMQEGAPDDDLPF